MTTKSTRRAKWEPSPGAWLSRCLVSLSLGVLLVATENHGVGDPANADMGAHEFLPSEEPDDD